MKLIEFSHRAGDWEINNLGLGDLNLIVGENAVGKSNTWKAIKNFSEIINDLTKHIQDNITDVYYFYDYENKITEYWFLVKFETESKKILSYEILIEFESQIKKTIEFENQINVRREILILDGKKIIYRESADKAEIYSESNKELISISPPSSSLVLKVRRDTKEYIEFEQLIFWASDKKFFSFCKINSYPSGVLLAQRLNNLDNRYVTSVLNDIGFYITDIDTFQISPGSSVLNHRFVFEEINVEKKFYYKDISQGLKRTINLIVLLENLVKEKPVRDRYAWETSPYLIIDDLGEGLDYRKATNLGKYLFKRCEEESIQLIAISNDNFLLDVVDLDHWNILTREGSKVSTINKKSHPKIFEDFMFTGLSNFDLLTSDFLTRKLKEYNPA